MNYWISVVRHTKHSRLLESFLEGISVVHRLAMHRSGDAARGQFGIIGVRHSRTVEAEVACCTLDTTADAVCDSMSTLLAPYRDIEPWRTWTEPACLGFETQVCLPPASTWFAGAMFSRSRAVASPMSCTTLR